eukprot:5811225-Amphidinium_carterae.1
MELVSILARHGPGTGTDGCVQAKDCAVLPLPLLEGLGAQIHLAEQQVVWNDDTSTSGHLGVSLAIQASSQTLAPRRAWRGVPSQAPMCCPWRTSSGTRRYRGSE